MSSTSAPWLAWRLWRRLNDEGGTSVPPALDNRFKREYGSISMIYNINTTYIWKQVQRRNE